VIKTIVGADRQTAAITACYSPAVVSLSTDAKRKTCATGLKETDTTELAKELSACTGITSTTVSAACSTTCKASLTAALRSACATGAVEDDAMSACTTLKGNSYLATPTTSAAASAACMTACRLKADNTLRGTCATGMVTAETDLLAAHKACS